MTEMPDVDNRPVDWEAVERLADDSRRRDAAGLNRAAEASIRALNLDRNGESIEPRHRMTVEPRTEAGRTLLNDFEQYAMHDPTLTGSPRTYAFDKDTLSMWVEAIESEARAAALREVAEKVRPFEDMLNQAKHGEYTIDDLRLAWWETIRPAILTEATGASEKSGYTGIGRPFPRGVVREGTSE